MEKKKKEKKKNQKKNKKGVEILAKKTRGAHKIFNIRICLRESLLGSEEIL